MTKVRFAPSPTGFLHLGNARMAIINYLLAKKLGGEFIIRIDDTDTKRVKKEYIEAVFEDLHTLGIKEDKTFAQSDRMELYNNFFEKLKSEGKVYECYETPEELEYKKKLQLAKGKPPIYDRSMLNITEEKRKQFLDEGRKPHYRLRIEHGETITWQDLIKGEVSFQSEHLSDPVVIREDGSFLYLLTSVFDDIESGITHIIRGEDHISNTAIQIQMFKYCNAHIPEHAHLPLITSTAGNSLSKREGSLSLRNLYAKGFDPMSINNYLFMIGLSETNTLYENLEEIIKEFDIQKYNKSSAKMDFHKLELINLAIIKEYSFDRIKKKANNLLNLDLTENFWSVVKNNITSFEDISVWNNILNGNLEKPENINQDLLKILLQTMPNNTWDENTWNAWIKEVKENTTLSGKELFLPIRKVLTGLDKGPEFNKLILILGKDLVTERIKKAL